MHVARWILAAIVVLVLIAIVYIEHAKRELVEALTVWAEPLAAQCAEYMKEPVCAQFAVPLGPPPVWAPVTGPAVPAKDLAGALQYAVSLVAQTTTSTLGFVPAPAVGGAPPTSVAAPAVDGAPFALVWVGGATGTTGSGAPWVAVGIRGTATPADFLVDARYGLTSPTAAFGVLLSDVVGKVIPDIIGPNLPGGTSPTVHSGFASTYANMRHALLNAIGAAPSTAPVFIAGHSLGAALAFLAAADVSALHPGRPVYVIGIAPPRVGNAAFVAWMAAQSGLVAASMINLADLVPSLPWSYMPVLTGEPAAFAHVEPVVVGTAIWPDAISCHTVPAYAAALTGANILAPAARQAPEWLPGAHSGNL